MSERLDPRIVEVTVRLGFDKPVSAWMATILAQQAIPKDITLTPKKDGDPTSVKVLTVRQTAQRR